METVGSSGVWVANVDEDGSSVNVVDLYGVLPVGTVWVGSVGGAVVCCETSGLDGVVSFGTSVVVAVFWGGVSGFLCVVGVESLGCVWESVSVTCGWGVVVDSDNGWFWHSGSVQV